jgi:hypothetical protein
MTEQEQPQSRPKNAGSSAPASVSNPVARVEGLRSQLLSGLFRENLNSILVSLLLGAFGTIGVILSPIREMVTHHVWSEKASVLLTTDVERVREGSSVYLKMTITPQAPRSIDPGVVYVKYDRSFLILQSKDTPFKSPEISFPTILPENGPLEFLARKPGTTVVEIDLETRYGSYSASKRIDIYPAEVGSTASRANFTGIWVLQIGNSRGQMEIRQSPGGTTISGTYYLDNGDKGVIDGWRDGVSFGAAFTRGSSVTKWIVEQAAIAESHGYVELSGQAYLAKASGASWVRSEGDLHFYATVKED